MDEVIRLKIWGLLQLSPYELYLTLRKKNSPLSLRNATQHNRAGPWSGMRGRSVGHLFVMGQNNWKYTVDSRATLSKLVFITPIGIGTSPSISHCLLACSICTYLQCWYCLLLILCNITHDDDDDDTVRNDAPHVMGVLEYLLEDGLANNLIQEFPSIIVGRLHLGHHMGTD